MAQSNPAAGAQQPDLNALTQHMQTLTQHVTQLAQGQASLVEALSRQAAPAQQQGAAGGAGSANAGAGTAGKGDKPQFLTAEDLTRVLDQRDQQRDQTARVSAARDRYAGEKLKDLPQTYRNLLPATDDPAKLAQAEQSIRQQYQADFGLSGQAAGKAPNVGGGQAGGASPAQTVDLSKLNPVQKIAMGLKNLVTPARPGAESSAGQQQPSAAAAGTTAVG